MAEMEEGVEKKRLTKAEKRAKKKKPSLDEECEFVFFHGIENVFSQFHPVKFTVDGVEYNCMEQYMHHQKAVTFNDEEIAQQIMDTDDPKLHKKLGRRVQNFEENVWNIKSIEVVKMGSFEKYRQNPDMLGLLLATYPKLLAEASPNDTIWGIGLPGNSKKARDRTLWRGKNQLGQCLTEVRDQLLNEKEKKDGV